MDTCDPTRVQAIEAEVDAFYDRQFRMRGLWAPSAIDGLLENAEQVVLGYQPRSRHADVARSLWALSANTHLSLDACLLRVHRSCNQTRPPARIPAEGVTKTWLALGQVYALICDAFTSYWLGYSTASVLKPKRISFEPIGGELDARLRAYNLKPEPFIEGQSGTHEEEDGILQPGSPFMDKFAADFESTFNFRRQGGLTYHLQTNTVLELASHLRSKMANDSAPLPSVKLEGLSLEGLLQGWAVVKAVATLHKLVSMLFCNRGLLSTTANWPALIRPDAEWESWFADLPDGSRVLDTLTFDPGRKTSRTSLMPIVRLGDYRGIVPSLALLSEPRSSIEGLLAQVFPREYSTYSSTKETAMIQEAEHKYRGHIISTRIKLPAHDDTAMPDIDVLLRGWDANSIVVAEVKWLLPPTTTLDISYRDKYLLKGQSQLARIRDFLFARPRYLRQRGLITFATSPANTRFVLLSRGYLGSAKVPQQGSEMGDFDQVMAMVGSAGMVATLSAVSRLSYLPRVGSDFTVSDVGVRSGRWTTSWKILEFGRAPPDSDLHGLGDHFESLGKYIRWVR